MKTSRLAVIGTVVSAFTFLACSSAGAQNNAQRGSTPTYHRLPGRGPATSRSGAADSNWLSYQATPNRVGAVAADKAVIGRLKLKWTANLGGVVHGEAVAAEGRIFAATENDRIVALNPANGKVIWSRTIGRPLVNVDHLAGCGDIDPLGITGTPTVDLLSGMIYAVGEISTGGSNVHRQLVGLSLKTGKIELSRNVDPPLPKGETQIQLLQRDSLAVANGRAYIGYGGNDGDCGNYHGWVVSVALRGKPDLRSFMVDPGGQGGAIWQGGGAPAVDSSGDVYVTTGNSNPDPGGDHDPGKYAESVIKLSPTLRVLASYKDPVAGGDADLSTANPVLLPGDQVFSVGKTDNAYILSQRGLGHRYTVSGVCGSDPDGGPAYSSSLGKIFVPCQSGGLQVIDLKTRKLGELLKGANSTPILIGQRLWAMSYNGSEGVLYEYNPSTGAQLQALAVGTSVAHFASPSTADGLILTPTNSGLVAFGS